MSAAPVSQRDELTPDNYASRFHRTIFVVGVGVKEPRRMGKLMEAMRGAVFEHRGVKCVAVDEPSGQRYVRLNSTVAPLPVDDGGSSPTEALLSDEIKSRLARHGFALDEVTARILQVELTAANFTMTEILKDLLPAGVVVPSGFEQVGHIAHVNLHEEQLPFKHLIGRVLLDCNKPLVRTVVNKTHALASEFRELPLEVIAGDHDFRATIKQSGCIFVVPYDKVYWNSRLSEEHDRLVALMQPGDELLDVMAGVGPFVIPAVLSGIHCVGNDLNPAAVEAMKENFAANRRNVKPAQVGRFESMNMDGRAFIEEMRRTRLALGPLPALASGRPPPRRHFAMNLPALAMTFLDAFTGPQWQDDAQLHHDRSFAVHCYGFSTHSENMDAARADGVRQVETVLKHSIAQTLEHVHVVRDVAPHKVMVCVSFRLPDAIFDGAAATAAGEEDKEEPPTKKRRLDH